MVFFMPGEVIFLGAGFVGFAGYFEKKWMQNVVIWKVKRGVMCGGCGQLTDIS
jgi:hypothetical protein